MRMIRSAVETAYTAHQVHSPEIKLDGDTAHVVWAMQDRVVWGADRRPKMGYAGHTGYGHYHECYVRRDGRSRNVFFSLPLGSAMLPVARRCGLGMPANPL